MLKLFSLAEVVGGDTYEMAYSHCYPKQHWSADSLYFTDDENGIGALAPYLNAVFPNYAYYGPQKVLLSQWAAVEKSFLAEQPHNTAALAFFTQVKEWLANGNHGADYFWILGI